MIILHGGALERVLSMMKVRALPCVYRQVSVLVLCTLIPTSSVSPNDPLLIQSKPHAASASLNRPRATTDSLVSQELQNLLGLPARQKPRLPTYKKPRIIRDAFLEKEKSRSSAEYRSELRKQSERDDSNPLKSLIQNEIRQEKIISFERFMELSLYHPQYGYYKSGNVRIGEPYADVDFTTAPEAIPEVFASSITTVLVDMWIKLGRPKKFQVVEMGAGRGVLAENILEELSRRAAHYDRWTLIGRPEVFKGVKVTRETVKSFQNAKNVLEALQYVIVEISDALREGEQKPRLQKKGFPVTWVEDSAITLPDQDNALSEQVPRIFLSNELPDAFPVHRIQSVNGKLHEVYVTLDQKGDFKEVLVPFDESNPAYQKIQTTPLAVQDVIFVHLNNLHEQERGWEWPLSLNLVYWQVRMAKILKKSVKGYILTIDYRFAFQKSENKMAVRNYVRNRPLIFFGMRITNPVVSARIKRAKRWSAKVIQKLPIGDSLKKLLRWINLLSYVAYDFREMYLYPGKVDITSSVDFEMLEDVGSAFGLTRVGSIAFGQFFKNLGIKNTTLTDGPWKSDRIFAQSYGVSDASDLLPGFYSDQEAEQNVTLFSSSNPARAELRKVSRAQLNSAKEKVEEIQKKFEKYAFKSFRYARYQKRFGVLAYFLSDEGKKINELFTQLLSQFEVGSERLKDQPDADLSDLAVAMRQIFKELKFHRINAVDATYVYQSIKKRRNDMLYQFRMILDWWFSELEKVENIFWDEESPEKPIEPKIQIQWGLAKWSPAKVTSDVLQMMGALNNILRDNQSAQRARYRMEIDLGDVEYEWRFKAIAAGAAGLSVEGSIIDVSKSAQSRSRVGSHRQDLEKEALMKVATVGPQASLTKKPPTRAELRSEALYDMPDDHAFAGAISRLDLKNPDDVAVLLKIKDALKFLIVGSSFSQALIRVFRNSKRTLVTDRGFYQFLVGDQTPGAVLTRDSVGWLGYLDSESRTFLKPDFVQTLHQLITVGGQLTFDHKSKKLRLSQELKEEMVSEFAEGIDQIQNNNSTVRRWGADRIKAFASDGYSSLAISRLGELRQTLSRKPREAKNDVIIQAIDQVLLRIQRIERIADRKIRSELRIARNLEFQLTDNHRSANEIFPVQINFDDVQSHSVFTEKQIDHYRTATRMLIQLLETSSDARKKFKEVMTDVLKSSSEKSINEVFSHAYLYTGFLPALAVYAKYVKGVPVVFITGDYNNEKILIQVVNEEVGLINGQIPILVVEPDKENPSQNIYEEATKLIQSATGVDDVRFRTPEPAEEAIVLQMGLFTEIVLESTQRLFQFFLTHDLTRFFAETQKVANYLGQMA
ncbi:MAG: SAM-dependent methyltransferase [Candidatus Omnitrophica bacterium]|nr:SAM-dependent methyltransferase [Candidatus Omnitrophota bacterium]